MTTVELQRYILNTMYLKFRGYTAGKYTFDAELNDGFVILYKNPKNTDNWRLIETFYTEDWDYEDLPSLENKLLSLINKHAY